MSGITGIFHLDGSPVDGQILRAMTKAVAHRGPDGISHWVQGQVGLGHLQLCTTPESLRERQPLVSSDGSYVIVCDGRIDNRRELLRDLKPLTAATSESTDVDLVLQAYITWGEGCVKHIVGDFAFAIWDGLRQQLFCARDQLGMRPFNYYYDGRRFLFGSEIQSLFQCSDVPRELNEVMVGLYLSGSFGNGEQTFYQKIHQLPQGHVLLVKREGLTKRLYWELEPDNPVILANDAEYIERFLEIFNEAVRCQMRSITPVAVTLSGGLDSSSVICTAATLLKSGQAPPRQLHSFSAVFQEFPSADESTYIQEIHKQYGIQAHFLNADDLWGLKPMQGTYPMADYPFPIPYQARHEALLQQMRLADINVVLTGEGGDEIFAVVGQHYFWHLLALRQWRVLRRELKYTAPGWRRRFYKQVLWSLAPAWAHRLHRSVKPGVSAKPSVISGDFAQRIRLDEQIAAAEPQKKFQSPYWRDNYGTVLWLGRSFFLSYYAQLALWHRIEARLPFWSLPLVDFLFRVPPEQKIWPGRTKWLLRQAMSGILPEPIRQRQDKGDFSPLFSRGLLREEAARFRQLLENSYLTRLGYLDRDKLDQLYVEACTDVSYPVMIFISFFSLAEWLEQEFEGRGGGVPAIGTHL